MNRRRNAQERHDIEAYRHLVNAEKEITSAIEYLELFLNEWEVETGLGGRLLRRMIRRADEARDALADARAGLERLGQDIE